MSERLCERWPIASEKFSQAQLQIWDMKLSGWSFEKIQQQIAHEHGSISTSSLWACVKRTAIGKAWRPHSFEGRSRFLNADDEVALSEWVNAEEGGRTMQEFIEATVFFRWRAIMESAPVLHQMGCHGIVDALLAELTFKSRAWGYALLHDLNLKLVAPEVLEAKRYEYGTSALITRWFAQMRPEVEGTDPSLIFNFDEMMLYSMSDTKVIVSADKKAFRRKAPMGPHVTLGLCVSPTGVRPPPLIIIPSADPIMTFNYFQSINLVQIANSPSGWMTTEIFTQWATLFCKWLQVHRLTLAEQIRGQKCLLYVDNCRSHCSLEALNIFQENNVKVISFPPHVTHILQPVDVSCARAFKSELWKETKYFEKNMDKFVTVRHSQAERRRVQLVLATLSSLGACNFRVCSNGFRRAGIYPFDQAGPLASDYVVQSVVDPEENLRQMKPHLFHTGSSVMTSNDFLARLARYQESRNTI
jgi:hypothetical protein